MGWLEPEYMKTAKMFYNNVLRLTEPWSNDRIKKLKENKIKKVCIPISPDTIPTVSVAVEAAKATICSLSDEFYNPHYNRCIGSPYWGQSPLFNEIAVNYLAACIYFFAQNNILYSGPLYRVKYKFAHILFFLNCDINEQLEVLKNNNELIPLIKPVMNLFDYKDAFYIVTAYLHILFAKILSKENIWLMNEDEYHYYPSLDGDFNDHLNKLYTTCQEDVRKLIDRYFCKPSGRTSDACVNKDICLQSNIDDNVDNLPTTENLSTDEVSYEEILMERYSDNEKRFDSLIDSNNENSLVIPDFKELLPSEAFRVMMCQPNVLNGSSKLIIRKTF